MRFYARIVGVLVSSPSALSSVKQGKGARSILLAISRLYHDASLMPSNAFVRSHHSSLSSRSAWIRSGGWLTSKARRRYASGLQAVWWTAWWRRARTWPSWWATAPVLLAHSRGDTLYIYPWRVDGREALLDRFSILRDDQAYPGILESRAAFGKQFFWPLQCMINCEALCPRKIASNLQDIADSAALG